MNDTGEMTTADPRSSYGQPVYQDYGNAYVPGDTVDIHGTSCRVIWANDVWIVARPINQTYLGDLPGARNWQRPSRHPIALHRESGMLGMVWRRDLDGSITHYECVPDHIIRAHVRTGRATTSISIHMPDDDAPLGCVLA